MELFHTIQNMKLLLLSTTTYEFLIDTGIDTKEIIKFACRGGMDRPITYNYRIRSEDIKTTY